MKEAKQIIVVRKDLGMSRGKMAAQVAHASIACVLKDAKQSIRTDHIPTETRGYMPVNIKGIHLDFEEGSALDTWLNGRFTKIVLSVENKTELLQIYIKSKESGLNTVLITDAGLTEFEGPTNTCVGIGPHFPERFIGITDHLKTFR